MAYADVTFSANETLTSTKMNQMAANDKALHDGTGIAAGAITADKIDFTTLTDSNGWTKIPISNNIILYLKEETRYNISMGGNTWREETFSVKPSDLDTPHPFFGGAGGVAGDHAVNVCGYIPSNGEVVIQLQNIYGGSVSTHINWWAYIIEIIPN